MGQANYRGALPSNIIEELEHQNTGIDELHNLIELAEGTRFLGYLILDRATEEFLHETMDSPGKSIRSFAETPHMAYRFRTFADANKLARYDRGESIVALFDLGDDQLLVAQLHDEREEGSYFVH